MNLVKSIMYNNPCYKAGKKIKVKGLMLHSVGCPQPNATVFIKQWNKETYKTSCVHGIIDGNTGIVYQTLPWNHRGWHSGRSNSNNTHIGVEIGEPDCIKYITGSKFTCSNLTKAKASVKKTYNSAVELFAMLCKEYKLNPLTDIISHKEGYKKGMATNHGDPEHLWKGLDMGYTMNGFRKAVKKAMEEEVKKEIQNETSKKTVNQIAKEVIAGKWGTGENRKKLLTKAGYDYSVIQKEVNRLMK